MTSPRVRPASFSPLVFLVCLAVSVPGCSSSKSTSLGAQFTASTTASAPGLVKLVLKSKSGARMIVDAVIYGPDASLDLYTFRFAVKIGDTSVVKFVPLTSYTQTALVAGNLQTVTINVDDSADPSMVECTIQKTGGGAGDGIAGASAVVIELVFDAKTTGSTTLTLIGEGANPPQALDSADAPIAAVAFDALAAGVKGVATSMGGGY